MSWLKQLVGVLPVVSALPVELETTTLESPHTFEERMSTAHHHVQLQGPRLIFILGSVCSGNTATTRSQWCQYSINTDYYNSYPNTGQTVTYNFVVEEVTLAPDGVPRLVQSINGQFPGPAITANW